jgi:hypothetical protein
MPPNTAATDSEANVRTVEAAVNYVAPGSFINRRFVAPGVEHNTGQYESHRVLIRDGRSIKNHFSLDVHGFVLAERATARTVSINSIPMRWSALFAP